MTDDEMRQHVVAWLGRGWPGDAIRQAPTVADAAAVAREAHGSSGGTGPHLPHYSCGPSGVTYYRESGDDAHHLTWHEVAKAVRSGATQLSLL